MYRATFHIGLLNIRYWPTWFAFGVLYAVGWLPYRVQMAMGDMLGAVLYRVVPRRRAIAYRNFDLCFPEKTHEEKTALVKGVMASTGKALFETGMAWFWPRWRLDRCYTLEGLEHLTRAKEDGVGVILMAFHFSHTDIGAKFLGLQIQIDGTYRPHNNPVYDYIQHNGRAKHSKRGMAIPRDNVRAMVKGLRAGRIMWYAPDQDYGPKNSIFVPFFGVPAATVTATAQLARMGNARVIPFTQTRKKDGSGYHLTVFPPLQDFPSGDEYKDAELINRFLEKRILEQPDQYHWVHRRFKTRPEGEPDLYKGYI